MPGTIAPFPRHQFFDNVGNPASGYKLFTYAAGTTTKAATYTDVDLTSANANPIVLDSAGRATIYLSATSYKFVLAPPTDTDPPTSPLWTQDNVAQVPVTNVDLDVAITAGENLAQYDCVYLSDGSGGKTAGRWYKTDADLTYASSGARAVGIVLNTVLAAASGTVRVAGRMTSLSALTVGSVYYASATSGALTSTAPTNSREVGVADSTTSLLLPALLVPASATLGGYVTIEATEGGELADALGPLGWTAGAGWDISVVGTLNKNADGVGTVAPTTAITPVVGTTYKVVITVGALTVASGATYTLGGTVGPVRLDAAGTYTHYVTATTTANLIITPTLTGTRFTITAVSIKALGGQTLAGYKTFDNKAFCLSTLDVKGVASFLAHPKFAPGASTGVLATARGLLNAQYDTKDIASAAETDAHSYTLPANTLNANGRVVKVTAWGTFGSAAATRTLKVYIGATAFTIYTGTSSSNKWFAVAYIIKTGANTQDATGALVAISGVTGCFFGTAAITDTADIVLKTTITGSGGTAGEITEEGFLVEVVG